jgi:hypothetical protein
MRHALLTATLAVSLAAQNNQPNCTGIARDVDARCGCVKDPNSKLCEMVKAGFYEPTDFSKVKPMNVGLTGTYQPAIRSVAPNAPAPASKVPPKPQAARVVALTHKDYLRFLHPNAYLAAGFDFGKMLQSPDLMAGLFGQTEGEDARMKVVEALKEMDHLWLSFAAPNDIVILITGRFEQGVTANMFYSQGIRPVFLGGAHAMLVGSDASMSAALARLSAVPSQGGGWVAKRARELAKDHETWIVNEPLAGMNQATALQSIRQFSVGFKLADEGSVDGEAVADSDASAEKIVAWFDLMKAATREKTGAGALEALMLERAGSSLKFSAKGDALLSADAGKTAMNSDFGVELYAVMMAGFPGVASHTVAQEKLLAVKAGMKKDEVLSLLGRPLSVAAIQGLDVPRETWTYQVPFGKQLSMRLDGGVVTTAPR